MRYTVTSEFTRLNETSGTIQNTSNVYTLEVTSSTEKNSGFLLYPLNQISFSGSPIYIYCIDLNGIAEARVVDFISSSTATSTTTDDTAATADLIQRMFNSTSGDEYFADPDADALITEMWNSSAPIEADNFTEYLDDIFNP